MMEKWKMVLLGTALGTALLLSGCGEAEKYNKAKDELTVITQQVNEEVRKVKDETFQDSLKRDTLSAEELNKNIESMNQYEASITEKNKQIDEKLAVMKEMQNKEPRLMEDYQKSAYSAKVIKGRLSEIQQRKKDFEQALKDLETGDRIKHARRAFGGGWVTN